MQTVNGYVIGSRANLSEANLSEANLSGADLYGANLRGANLRWADLSGADLYGADLSEADLRGADLRGADLRGADLSGANIRWANLRWANLRGVTGIKSFGYPYSWHVILIAGVANNGVRVAAGCRWFTFKEATRHWTKKRKDRLVMIPILAAMKQSAKENNWRLHDA